MFGRLVLSFFVFNSKYCGDSSIFSYSTPVLDFQSPVQVNEQSLKETGRRRKCRGDRHGVRMGTGGKGEAGEKGAVS